MLDVDLFGNIIPSRKFATIPDPPAEYAKSCEVILEEDLAIEVLNSVRREWKYCAFDYETTGKKPYRDGHDIYSMSLSNGRVSYSFLFFSSERFLMAVKRLLLSRVKLVAHNGKFEALWTYICQGYWLDLYWDTMLGEHSIANQERVGLKPLVKKYFGVEYNDGIVQYFASTKEEKEKYGCNAFNFIKEAPIEKVLMYGALDALFTYRIFEEQVSKFDAHMEKGRKFFVESSIWLAKVECEGLRRDAEKAEEVADIINAKLRALEAEVRAMDCLKKWDRPAVFSMSNPNHLSHLVYDILGEKATEFTPAGKPKAGKDQLEVFNLVVVDKVIEWRKFKKALTTYLGGFGRETVDEFLRFSFKLLAASFRGSCVDPNLQNVPKRDKEIMGLLRSVLFPKRGCRLAEYDYKAVEVSVGACYHMDPTMLKYVSDLSTDMHRDIGMMLFLRTKETLTKAERQVAKNGFVFPTFYGSYYKQTGENMWKDMPAETKRHLKSEGIRTKAQFIKHVRSIEDDMWNVRFGVYYDWRFSVFQRWEKTGKVSLKTGFYCTGDMDKKDTANYQIQGSAFHVLLWTLVEVSKELERRGLESRVVLQIHDALILNIYDEEMAEVDAIIYDIGTIKVREHWDWLVVPLVIEKSVTEIDGSWADIKEIGYLKGVS